jgi:hypothetical protein
VLRGAGDRRGSGPRSSDLLNDAVRDTLREVLKDTLTELLEDQKAVLVVRPSK